MLNRKIFFFDIPFLSRSYLLNINSDMGFVPPPNAKQVGAGPVR